MGERRFFDVSIPIENGMVVWPGDGPVKVERIRSMEKGERLNLSRLEMNAHTGTHLDAPVHFLRDGVGIDGIPLETLVGPARLVSITGVREIGMDSLLNSGIPAGTRRLLIKTDNGRLLEKDEFDPDYAFITPDGARYLVQLGIRLVGVDYFSIAQYGKGDEVHRELLGAGIAVIEGLDLREVPAGSYRLMAFPLRIRGADGAPARVILEEQDEEERKAGAERGKMKEEG